MNWHHRSTVERMKPLIEGLFVPDPSSSLLISLHGTGPDGGPEDEMYLDMYFRFFPPQPRSTPTLGAIDLGEGFVDALREAINALSLPGYVRVEEIEDNSWRLGYLHGMRRVRRFEKSFLGRCMDALLKPVNIVIHTGIGGFINLHFLVAAAVSVFAATVQNDVLTAITPAVLSLAIVENMNWRSLQKQRLAKLVYGREAWRESEVEYQKRLGDICGDPNKWRSAKVRVYIWIFTFLFGDRVKRFYIWNENRQASIRLEKMGADGNSS